MMKFTAVVFALLLVVISALPQDNTDIDVGQERLITRRIEAAIAELSATMRRRGMDPMHRDGSKEVPIPFGGGKIWISDGEFTGISDIQTPRMRWVVATSRLYFTILWPSIVFETTSMGAEITVMGRTASATGRGRLELRLQVDGGMRFLGSILRDCNMLVSGRAQSKAVFAVGNQEIPLDSLGDSLNDWLDANGAQLGEQMCTAARAAIRG